VTLTRREALTGAAGLMLGCGPVRDAFRPAGAQSAPSCDPRIALTMPPPRTGVRTTLGALVQVPRSWVGWTQAIEDALLLEVDATLCEGPADDSEGALGETVGAFCVRAGWEVYVGPPSTMEYPTGLLVAGYACATSRSLVCAWTLTRDLRSDGTGARLAALSHEARHGRRYALGLDPCWAGHGSGCSSMEAQP